MSRQAPPASQPADSQRESEANARTWLTFAVITIGSFLGPLAGSIVIVALPTMAPHFNVDLQSVKWIVTVFLAVSTALLPVAGKLGQWLGASRVYIAGFVVFSIGSALCAITPGDTLASLVGFRALQAVGAALIFGVSPALVVRCIPGHRRSLAFGIIGSVVAVALIIAQPLGVYLSDNFGWPWVFWVQVPVALAGAVFGWWLLPPDLAREPLRVPWRSILSYIGMIAAAVIVSEALSKGLWAQYLPYTAIATLALGGLFAYAERRQPTLFDYGMFKHLAFRQGAFAAVMAYAIMFMLILLLPFYFDDYLQLSTMKKALLFGISPLVTTFAGPAGGALADKIGFRVPIIGGLGVLAGAYALLAYAVSTANLSLLGWGLALLGLGNGMFSGPNYSAMMGSVSLSQRSVASSFVSLTRNISFLAGASGGALLFSLVLWWVAGHELMLSARTHELPEVVPLDVFTVVLSRLLLLSCGVLAVGMLASLRYPNRVETAE